MTIKVLVADDSATIQKVIKIAFSHYPVTVLEASSYIEAMRLAQKGSIDVIIADSSLVGTYEPSDFKTMQEAADNCPLLLLAGSYDGVDESKFVEIGLTHFLKKPFDTAGIIKKLSDELLINFEEPDEPESQPAKVKKTTKSPPSKQVISASIAAESTEVKEVNYTRPLTKPTYDVEEPAGHQIGIDDADMGSITDTKAKGRRAFEEDERTQAELPPTPPVASVPKSVSSTPTASSPEPLSREELRDLVTPMMREELRDTVQETVVEYCERNFDELAREVIKNELRRLAEEKSQHLANS